MPAPIVQAQYDSLEEIAKRFDQQASDTEKMARHLIQMLEQLEGGGWEGDSAQAFFREMNDEVIPTTNNLRAAFTESSETTRQIVQVMQAAEEEAGNQFDLSQSSSSQSGGSVGTQPNGTGTQPGGPIAPNAPTGGGAGQSSSIWDNFEFQGKGDIWKYDHKNKKGGFDPSIGIVYGTKDLAAFGDPNEDGFSAVGGKGGIGLGVDGGGAVAGAYGEFYVGQGKIDGVYGDEDLAVTGGVTGKVLSADGFVGYKDGSVGMEIGGSLASVEGEVGVNVLGANVGVKGEIGLKAELGFSIGKETQIKLPFVTIGFSFGGAKE